MGQMINPRHLTPRRQPAAIPKTPLQNMHVSSGVYVPILVGNVNFLQGRPVSVEQ